MMNQSLQNQLQDQLADSLYDSFNGGTLKIFGDSLIVTIDLPSPAFNPANGGRKSINGPWQADATAAGMATRCQFTSADGSKVLEGTVTARGGGGDVELDNVNINTGQMVTIVESKGLTHDLKPEWELHGSVT